MRLVALFASLVGLALFFSLGAPAGEGKPVLIEEVRPASTSLRADVRDVFVVNITPGTKKVRAWFELPLEEPLQRITDLKITAPDGYRIENEKLAGNRFLYVEIAEPKAASIEVVVTFTVERWESAPSAERARALTSEEKEALASQLAEFPNGEATDKIQAKTEELAKGVEDPVAQARKFYDYIIDNAEYWKKDPERLKASGKGSASYCMDCKTGNCTDFHSLYQAMARVVDLPTQFVMGTALRKELDGVEKFDEKLKEPSYHCWVRTYFPGRGWVYSDISYADVTPEKKEYYFDHVDANRVAFSCGRNIDLAPKQDRAKLNWFIKCYVEADGEEHTAWSRELTYRSSK
ncbi:MAG: transglutaminase domain-containing [Planctomycetota bacterium]|nr:MAG: transglutaminase domain-containing [Planctomycetota bacterium]